MGLTTFIESPTTGFINDFHNRTSRKKPFMNEHTLTQLRDLRLDGMVHALEDQASSTADLVHRLMGG